MVRRHIGWDDVMHNMPFLPYKAVSVNHRYCSRPSTHFAYPQGNGLVGFGGLLSIPRRTFLHVSVPRRTFRAFGAAAVQHGIVTITNR